MTVFALCAFASSFHTVSNRSFDGKGCPAWRTRQARMANSLGVRDSGSPWSMAVNDASSTVMSRASNTEGAFAGCEARRMRAFTRAMSSRGLKGFTT